MNRIAVCALCAFPALSVSVGADADAARADVGARRTADGAAALSSWVDVDGDGRMELAVLSERGELRLLRLAEPGRFVDASEGAGLGDVRDARVLVFEDYDGDGWTDLFVGAISERSRLFRNEGGGVFRDVTAVSGLAVEGEVLSARWLDHDGDGRLDLHVVTRDASRLFRGSEGGVLEAVALPPGTSPSPTASAAGPAAIQVASGCASSIRNAANPSECFTASSLPQLGKLFPINRRLFVDSMGRVGFGTTSPTSKMHLVTTAPSHCIVYLQSSGPTYGESGIRFRTGNTTLSGWDLFMDDSTLDELGDPDRLGFYHAAAGVVMVLDIDGSEGKVGINKRDPSVALDVEGDVCASGMYLTCSDARLKTNVADLSGALDTILALRGVTFDRLRDERSDASDDARELGLVAQEVAAVLPEIVARGSDGYHSVDYGRLTPVLVEAIREQQELIEDLQAANAAARRENRSLQERVESIATRLAALETTSGRSAR